MESVIEPVLESVAGNIEIAIYTAPEIENPLTDIYQNNEKRINKKLIQLHASRKNGPLHLSPQVKPELCHIITTSYSSCI